MQPVPSADISAPVRWESYDQPALRDAVTASRADGLSDVLIALENMHCSACVSRLEKLLREDATDLRFNLAARTLEFAWNASTTPLSALLQKLERAGFAPKVLAQDHELRTDAIQRRAELARIGVSGVLAMQIMMLAWPSYFDGSAVTSAIDQLLRWTQWVLASTALLYCGWPFFASAWESLRARAVNMDIPVSASMAIAYIASAWRTVLGSGDLYFDTVSMFVFLLSAGRYLEGRTRAIAGERLRVLAGRRALTALRETGDRIERVPIGTLAIGDRIRVAPGESVPVDGMLQDQAAQLDESLLTGESRPINRAPGDRVLAGSLNAGLHSLCLIADRLNTDTRLSQILRLLSSAQASKTHFQALTDRLSGQFSLVILVIAGLATGWWWNSGLDQSLSVALAVLVISCPCALSLAVPAAIAAATSRLAGQGVLVARVEALMRLPRVDTVLFDKTGTLTTPELRVACVRPLTGLGVPECLRIAAALESGLSHPIARAFPASAPAADVRIEHGCGVRGTVDGQRYWIGAPEEALIHFDWPAVISKDAPEDSYTWILLADDQQGLALIGLSSPARPEMITVLRELKAHALAVEVLTGDRAEAAQELTMHIPGVHVFARLLPEEKLARLHTLQQSGHTVMAVGDGINDAPFLSAADVAVALPQGAAVTQARADIILVNDSLQGLMLTKRAAEQMNRRIRENLAWALAYNLVMIPLAVAGLLTPWVAALGMSVSSLTVVVNALRSGGTTISQQQAPSPAPTA